MSNKIICFQQIVNIVIGLLDQVFELININDKKNEVDELIENIAILCTKEIIELSKDGFKIKEGLTIQESIEKLAHSKAKSYLSLSSKSIFKFMDMIEM